MSEDPMFGSGLVAWVIVLVTSPYYWLKRKFARPTDHSRMRLGRRETRHDHRTLRMARYLTETLPTPPPRVDYSGGIVAWGMMLNDELGCCTIAALGHAVQTWTRNVGGEVTVPDSTILEYYEKWDGYDPKDPTSDQGGVELDVLKQYRQQGFAGHTLDAFVAIDLSPQELAQAIWVFGGVYIGVALPIDAQHQNVWDVTSGPDSQPGSWGGHAIYVVGYDFSKPGAETLTCVTWGKPKTMTLKWFNAYCEEAYALVSRDWLNASGKSPNGLDLATLEADLKMVSA